MNNKSVYRVAKSAPARMLAMIITMALVVAGSFSMFSAPAKAADNLNETDKVNELLDYINDYREDLGLQRVKINTGISRVSLDWAVYLADTGAFGHNPNYATDKRVYDGWAEAGEIVAMNPQGDVKGMFEQWVNSPPHHRIMVKPEFNLASIGMATDKYGQLYGVMNFYNYRSFEGVPNTYDSYPAPGTVPDPEDIVEVPEEEEEIPEEEDPVVEEPIEEPTDPVEEPSTPVEEPKPTTPEKPKPTTPEEPKPTTPTNPRVSFTDVPKKQVFASEINEIAEKGVTRGWEMKDGTYQYRPYANVNRDVMIVFIYRAMGSPEYTAPKKSPFTDVSTKHVFYKEITWAQSEGITEGWKMKNGTYQFRPAQPVKRSELAMFLMRASGDKAPKASSKAFADVKSKHPHATGITWMKEEGLSNGWKNGSKLPNFRPNSNTKRDTMAAFMIRWMDHTGYNGTK